jgi:hypothetical protein
LAFILLANSSCIKKNTSNKVSASTSCTWTFKNQTTFANKCFLYSDSMNRFVFYGGDSTSNESVSFHIPLLSLQPFNFTNQMDSTGLSLNHLENGIVYIGLQANSGTINVTSLTQNLVSSNFTTLINGESCIGTFSDVLIN